MPETLERTELDIDAEVTELRRQGRQINFVGSILVVADESVFCIFDGEERDVRSAIDRAGIAFARILETTRSDRRGQ